MNNVNEIQNTPPKVNLEKIQVRFSPDVIRSIERIAIESGISKAEAIRRIVDAAIEHYDSSKNSNMNSNSHPNQALRENDIYSLICHIEALTREIHRIGDNYSYVIHNRIDAIADLQQKQKQAIAHHSFTLANNYEKQLYLIKAADTPMDDKDTYDLAQLLDTYETVSKRIGEYLSCHIPE